MYILYIIPTTHILPLISHILLSPFTHISALGFVLFSFQGNLLCQVRKERLYQFEWRPRPKDLMTPEDKRKIIKNLKVIVILSVCMYTCVFYVVYVVYIVDIMLYWIMFSIIYSLMYIYTSICNTILYSNTYTCTSYAKPYAYPT